MSSVIYQKPVKIAGLGISLLQIRDKVALGMHLQYYLTTSPFELG